jgi:hypothetical protein
MADKFRAPAYDLASCVDVAQTIYAKGGTASSAELATYLGYKSVKNGAFASRVAATRLFGLIEGPSNAYVLTELGLRVLAPETDAAGVEDRVTAFLNVPLYRAFFERYRDQQLPPEDGLCNGLRVNFGVPADQARTLLNRLLDSAEQAGLFSVAGSRSRMIRPTAGRAVATPPPPGEDGAGPNLAPRTGSSRRARDQKLVDGVLDLMPAVTVQGGWSEEGLRQWLQFLEGALRVIYQLPDPNSTRSQVPAQGAS